MITILQEIFFCTLDFFKHVWKLFTNKLTNIFSNDSTILLFGDNHILSICNCCCHKVSNIHSYAAVTSFSSKTEIKYFSRFSVDHALWSSRLEKRVHFISKTCVIQIEFYTLLLKVCKNFVTNFSSKLKPQF